MVQYTTAALVEAELRATAAFSGSTTPTLAQATTWIEEESAYIDRLLGYSIASASYTDTIDYQGEEVITLKHSPVISVNSVLYSTSELGTSGYALSATKVDGTDYTVYTDSGEIKIIQTNWSPSDGDKRIQVNYTAGYATTPYTIQKLATKLVASRVLDTLIHQNVNESNDGGTVQVGTIKIVEPGSYGVNSYQSLNTDIGMLKDELLNNFAVHRYTMRT
jgi:hypothetical protein